ncbi:MAG: potassium/proton antiporter [Myxococcaceae bacterium]|nr:potassium/proton antiporter [Myxococcaceae bacterium]MCI0673904.1 potassium/proton antiporter [Myxococcaceae bacterium]
MTTSEPYATALLLVIFGLLMAVSAVFSRASGRLGVPVALLFLIIGMIAGREGVGGVAFDDYRFAFRLGTVALTLILFDGGLNTPLSAVREGARPAAVLATVGVAATALLVAVGARMLFGLEWMHALLLGAVVSSTDAAAVFAVLRSSGIQLKRRVGATLELESGLNDPMAAILTLSLTEALSRGEPLTWHLALEVGMQLAMGGVLGLGIGYAGRALLTHVRLPAAGLYAVLTFSLAFLAYGLPTLVEGSGLLSVYVVAVVLGNGKLPYRTGLIRIHDALAWLSQVAMFLVLGLLVFPSRLLQVAWLGVGLGLLLGVLVRPLVVTLCLLPFRFRWKEVLYISWVGLRGAVPIIFATFPVLAGVTGADALFHIVFFIVVVNSLVPGTTVKWVTHRLGLQAHVPPAPQAVLEIASMKDLHGDVLPFYIDEASAVAGSSLADIPLPAGATLMLLVRGDELVGPRGDTVLQPQDHVYVFCRPEDRALVQLLFGRLEEE